MTRTSKRKDIRYIYFGTAPFAAFLLEHLLKKEWRPVAIVTQPDRPAGRGRQTTASPVAVMARASDIPVVQPERLDAAFLESIQEYSPDVFIVAAYGNIIPKRIFAFPKHQTLNIHPSLLPFYRGPSPIQSTILNGDIETGATLMLVDEKVDHGSLIAQKKISLLKDETTETLTKKLALEGALMLMENVPAWVAGTIRAVPQDHARATWTSLLKKEDGRIDWTQSATQIDRHIRAMVPWPGSWTMWEKKGMRRVIKIKKAHVIQECASQPAGAVFELRNDTMLVACGSNILAVTMLQQEGKRAVTAPEFVRGNPTIIGSVLSSHDLF